MPPDTTPESPESQQPTAPPTPPDQFADANQPSQPSSSSQPVVTTSEPKKSGSKMFMLLIIAILVAAAAAGAWYVSSHRHHTTTTATKKDIPYLTDGEDTAGDLSVGYPVETSDTTTTILLYAQLYEGLVRYQDQTKIVPLLATSWSNPNDTTWLFNLRQGIKFHSGRTMTAADVKYSLDYAVAHQNDNSGATNLALASTISQVDVVNPYQVKIVTNGPDPVLLNRLAFLFVIDSKVQLGSLDAGTGPYVVKPSTKPASSTIDLVASSNYWGGHIYTRAVHMQTTTNNNNDQLAADAAKGKYDIAGDFDAKQLAAIKNYKAITVPDLGVSFLGLNTLKASSPLSSLAARQAVAYALNVPDILKAGSLNGTPANQLIPPLIPGYDSAIANTPYNPTKAKQLLATVSNAKTPITLSYPTGDEGQLGEISKELSAVGFNVKLAAINSIGDLVNQAIGGQTDMFYLTYGSSTLDGLDIINSTVEGTQNYSNTELDSLTKKASSTIDPAARIAILQQIEQQIHTNIPVV